MTEGLTGGAVAEAATRLSPYVPRLSAEWDLDAPGATWRSIESTCVYIDISGFTTISERLGRLGRIGAEQLTDFLDTVFSSMLGIAGQRGGSLLKFGGDSLLLHFSEGDHARLAADAAAAMRAALRETGALPTAAGKVALRSSMGVNSGEFEFFRVGGSHKELLIAGPAASRTIAMEQHATAGIILLSESTMRALPTRAVGAQDGPGWRLRTRHPDDGGPGLPEARTVTASAVAACVPTGLREWLSDPTGGSEHRLASVAFVRFQGVDDLLAAKGPQRTAQVLDELVTTVQEIVDAEGVTFLATDIDTNGGKIILTAGVPSAKEDDEGRVLRSARAIQDAGLGLPIQIGVNRDHVFAGDVGARYRRTYTVMGDGVNVAARLAANTLPGTILATASVLDRSRTEFATTELEPLHVKGKKEPLDTWRVGELVGVKTARSGFLPFRGRDEELASLVEALEACRDGRGAVVVVEGERGSGKSRLIAELEAAGHACHTLTFQGEPFGVSTPYLPLRGAIRSMLGITESDRAAAGASLAAAVARMCPQFAGLAPLLAPLVDAELDQTPETEAIGERFVRPRTIALLAEVLYAGCRGPLLLVAEDAHWFDDSSTEVLEGLAAEASSRPWLLCATRRPAAGGFSPQDEDLGISLARLTDAVARALVDEATESAPLRPQERDRLVAQASGNPLFLEELLRIARSDGLDSLPESLDAIAMREIDALPRPARRCLLIASVLGRAFDRATFVHLVAQGRPGNEADALDGLGEVLFPEGDGQLRFRHALLQESAYQSLPYRTRLSLHRSAGAVIEEGSGDPEEVATTLSWHYFSGEEWAKTWRFSRLAAKSSLEAHAPSEAATHLERAVAAGRRLAEVPGAEVAGVLSELGDVAVLNGVYDRADDAYRRAATAYAGDPVARAHIANRRAYLRTEYQGRPAAAVRQVHAGLDALREVPSPNEEADRERARLVTREAVIRLEQGRLNDAIRLAEEAVRECELVGHRRTLALALSTLDQALAQVGRAHEAANMERALEIYEELGDFSDAAMTLGNLGAIAFYQTRWERAADFYRRSAAAATAAGDLATAAIADVNLGELLAYQGDLAEAITLLSPSLRTLGSFGYHAGAAQAMMLLGRARALAGEPAEGLAQLSESARLFSEAGIAIGALEARGHLAEVLVALGDLAAATDALRDARATMKGADESPLASLLDRAEIAGLAAQGEHAKARDALDPAIERARSLGATYDLFVLLTLATRLGRTDAEVERSEFERDLGVSGPLPI